MVLEGLRKKIEGKVYEFRTYGPQDRKVRGTLRNLNYFGVWTPAHFGLLDALVKSNSGVISHKDALRFANAYAEQKLENKSPSFASGRKRELVEHFFESLSLPGLAMRGLTIALNRPFYTEPLVVKTGIGFELSPGVRLEVVSRFLTQLAEKEVSRFNRKSKSLNS